VTPSPQPGSRMRAGSAVVLAVVLLLALRPLAGFDTWWHLASGRAMSEQGGLLHEDPFTFTAQGHPWLNHEWLWQGIAWRLYEAAAFDEPAGASALTIATALVYALAFTLGYRALRRRGTGPWVSLALVSLCAWGAQPRFLARPEMATVLAIALLLGRLSKRSPYDPGVSGNDPIVLPALIAVAVNLHPGALILPGLVILHSAARLAGEVIAERRLPDRAALGRESVLGGLCVAATFLNPAGPGLWLVPFELSRIVKTGAYHNPEWLAPTPATAPVFFAAMAAAVLLLARAVPGRRLTADALPLLALGALSLTGYRHIALFLAAVPFGVAVPAATDPLLRESGLIRRTACAGVLALVLTLSVGRRTLSGEVGLGVDEGTTPVAAVRFLEETGIPGRLYNDVRFGGYLDWRFPKDRRVFIDGRNELFVSELSDVSAVLSGRVSYDAWLTLCDRWRFDAAVVRYHDEKKSVLYPARAGEAPRTGLRAWSAFLFLPERWALVYWDDTALVFLRRGGPNDALAKARGYETVSPEDIDHQLERAASDSLFRAALERDLSRRLSENPPSRRAAEFAEALRSLPPAPRS